MMTFITIEARGLGYLSVARRYAQLSGVYEFEMENLQLGAMYNRSALPLLTKEGCP
jgi:hypothetical protein